MKYLKQFGVWVYIILMTVLIVSVDNKTYAAANDFEFWMQNSSGERTITRAEWDSEITQYGDYMIDVWVRSVGTEKKLGGFEAQFQSLDSSLSILSSTLGSYKKVVTDPRGGSTEHVLFLDVSNKAQNKMSVSLNPSVSDHELYYIPTTGIKLGSINIKDIGSTSSSLNLTPTLLAVADPLNNIYSSVEFQGFTVGTQAENADLTALSILGNNSNTQYVNASNFTGVDDTSIDILLTYQDSLSGLTITPTTKSASASVAIDTITTPILSGSTINVTVTDGSLVKVYQINVTVTPMSNENSLLSISSNVGTLTPVFSQGTLSYTLTLPYSNNQVTLSATKVDSKSKLFIDNVLRSSFTKTNLPVGNTTISFRVEAESGLTKTYDVIIQRLPASSQKDLDFLKISNVDIYNGDTTYNHVLDETKTTFNYNIKALDAKATILLSLDQGVSYSVISQNANSASYSLNKGESKTFKFKVVAEDLSELIYTVHVSRPLSSLTELQSVAIKDGSQTLTLTPLQGVYTYKLNSQSTSLDFLVAAKEGGSVEIIHSEVTGTVMDVSALPAGTYPVIIKVTSSDGLQTKELTVQVVKESDEKEITSVILKDRLNGFNDISNFTFDALSNTYSMTLGFKEISQIQIELQSSPLAIINRQSGPTLNQNGTNYVIGQHDFVNTSQMGTMQLVVDVVAENGTVKQYKIVVNRLAAESIKTLDSFYIDSTPVPNFIGGQSPISGGYGTIIVPGDTGNVNVIVEKTSAKSTVTYNGSLNPNIALERGKVKLVTVRVTAEDGTYYEYQVNVLAANTNNQITNILVRNHLGEALPLVFNPTTLVYEILVDYPTTFINIEVITPTDSRSVVTTGGDETGTKNLIQGLNTIKVFATSESGTKGTEYTLRVTRSYARTENSLETLQLSSSGLIHNLSPQFNPSILSYTLRVDDNISNITVSATTKDNGSKIISGLGVHNLTSGQTTMISVVVQSESGVNKTYIIEVKRANQISTLDHVVIDGLTYPVISTFNGYVLELSKVNYSKNSMQVQIILSDLKASFQTSTNYSGGVFNLVDGVNELIITVTAMDGTVHPNQYIIRVERQAPDLTKSLSGLEVLAQGSGANLISGFSPTLYSYAIRVNHNITQVTINPTLTSVNSSYTITPGPELTTLTLYPTNTTFVIRVYDQTGVGYRDYTVVVMRADDNQEINNITANAGSPFTFNKTQTDYDLGSLMYSHQQITFNIQKASMWSTILINGEPKVSPYVVSLVPGLNEITIQAVSEYGTDGLIYTFQVYRLEPSNDTSLKDLIVSYQGTKLIDEKTPVANQLYTLRVDRNISFVDITYLKGHSNQQVTVSPQNGGSITAGAINNFTITVTAEDMVTVSYYRIQIISKNDDSDFSNIKIDGVAITDIATYDDLRKTYVLNDAFNFNQLTVEISAVKQDSYSVLTGVGTKTLVHGFNRFEIYNTSEYGTKSESVFIELTRRIPQTDSTLESLSVKDLSFDNGLVFHPNTYNYVITLPSSDTRTTIEILATLGATPLNQKTFSGKTGVQSLPSDASFNVSFQITVKAEDQSQSIYTINVLKNASLSQDASIKEIIIDGVTYDVTDFTNKVLDLGSVIFSKQTIEIDVIPNDPLAKAQGHIGIYTLNGTGIHQFKFKVVAQDGIHGLSDEYTIQLIKLSQSSDHSLNSLSLEIDGIEYINNFNKDTLNYRVELSGNTLNTVLDATKNHPGAQLTGDLGSFVINRGEHIYKVFVTAEDGTKRTYTITVVVKSDDVELESNHVELLYQQTNLYTSFDPLLTNQLVFEVDYQVSFVQLKVTLPLGATLVTNNQLSIYDLTPGVVKIIEVQVQSESGVLGMRYQISVLRKTASSENRPHELSVVIGTDTYELDIQKQFHKLTLPDTVSALRVDAVLALNSTATGLGNYSNVTDGMTIPLVFRAENMDVLTYMIEIDLKSTDHRFKEIQVNGVNRLADFNASYMLYLGYVPYSEDTLNLFGILNDSLGTVIGNQSYTLALGINTITIQGVSEFGTQGPIYTILINRANPDNQNTLFSLEVLHNGLLIPFNEGAFDPTKLQYTITLNPDSTITQIFVDAVASNPNYQPTGTGEYTLDMIGGMIHKVIMVSVKSEDNITKTYQITITKNAPNQLSSEHELNVEDVKLIHQGMNYITFDPTQEIQPKVFVPYSVTDVRFEVDLPSKATLVIGTNYKTYTLSPSNEIIIEFQVQAEDQTLGKLYQITVERMAGSTENTLDSLTINFGNDVITLDPNVLKHTINIPLDIEEVIIDGTLKPGSTVIGLGVKDLTKSNIFIISVTSETGVRNDYIIEIKQLSDLNTLESIKIQGIERIEDFNAYQLSIEVPYQMTSISILLKANDLKASLFGDGSKSLNVGINEIKIYAVSESGIKGIEYTLVVTRKQASNNNYLSDLIVTDSDTGDLLTLSPVFNKDNTYYVINLSAFPNIKNIHIDGLAESLDSTVIGFGYKVLLAQTGASSQTFSVMVISQSGLSRTYDIVVQRAVNPDDDYSVSFLSLIGNDHINYLGTKDASKTFYNHVLTYEITVPFMVTSLNLTVSNTNGAVPSRQGTILLESDYQLRTTITFTMTSKTGLISPVYTIYVERMAPSDDVTLKSIEIDGVLMDGFDPEVTQYEMTVDSQIVQELNIVATKNNALQTLIGTSGIIHISRGVNIHTFKVISESGLERIYSIKITSLSFANDLLSLSVKNQVMKPSFDPDQLIYELTVDYTVLTIEILGTHSPYATIVGHGVKSLQVGLNVFEVYVMSEANTKGEVYILEVHRSEPSSDATLKNLTVKESLLGNVISFNPGFNKDITNYVIQIPAGVNLSVLFIEAEASNANAWVSGTGVRILDGLVTGDYHTILEVTVLAQDGTLGVYRISVYRAVDLNKDISITNISLEDNQGIKHLGLTDTFEYVFDPSIYLYEIEVPFSITSTQLTIETSSALVYGAGLKTFGNNNEIRYAFYIVSLDGTVQSDMYQIIVTRSVAEIDNNLSGIFIDGALIEGFDPSVLNYQVMIPVHLKDSIELSATKASDSSSVTGDLGNITLIPGTHVYSINVTSQKGEIKTYTLTISYVESNALLEELIIRTTNQETFNLATSDLLESLNFSSEEMVYRITVGEDTTWIHLTGAAVDTIGAQIMGFGTYQLTSGVTDITIYVRSADQLETLAYKIYVTKTYIPSNDASLKDLVLNGSKLEMDVEHNMYHIQIKSGDSSIALDASAFHPRAKVSILNHQGGQDLSQNLSTTIDNLGYGPNVYMIKVEAEDGSVLFYQLVIERDEASNEFVILLLISIFLLWVATIVYIIIKEQKSKDQKQSIDKDFFKRNHRMHMRK